MQKLGDTLRPSWAKLLRLEKTLRSDGCWRVSGNRKDDSLRRERGRTHWQRERNRKRWCEIIRTSEHAENARLVLELREHRSSTGRLRSEATAAPRIKDNRTLLERVTMRKASQARVVEKKGKSKDAGALVWNQQAGSSVVASGSVVCTQARLLRRSKRLNAQRWTCARPR